MTGGTLAGKPKYRRKDRRKRDLVLETPPALAVAKAIV